MLCGGCAKVLVPGICQLGEVGIGKRVIADIAGVYEPERQSQKLFFEIARKSTLLLQKQPFHGKRGLTPLILPLILLSN